MSRLKEGEFLVEWLWIRSMSLHVKQFIATTNAVVLIFLALSSFKTDTFGMANSLIYSCVGICFCFSLRTWGFDYTWRRVAWMVSVCVTGQNNIQAKFF